MTITGKTRKEAIQMVLDSALESHSFIVGNLDTNTNNNVIVNIVEGSVLNALIGTENSILSEYGGEFIISNNEFNIVDNRGSSHGFTIAYGKNISSIKETTDDTDLATVLIPKSGDYRLPEYYIDSPNVSNYEKRYFQEVDMNLDIWDGTNEKGDSQITIDEAYAIMRNTCSNMFTKDKVDQINFNYSVDLVALSKTEEYKEYSILETSNNGDTVKVKHKVLNLDLVGRINKTIYNVLLDKYSKVEIGFTKQDKTTVKQIKFAKDEIMLSVNNSINGVEATLAIQDSKISAVVQSKGEGMGWTLNQEEFKVACVGSSGASVTIDESGLTVEDGKFKLKDSGSTVFYVNLNGQCTADGGFLVEDSDVSCKIDAEGITLIGATGKVAKIQILDDGTYSGTLIKDDLYVEDVLRVFGNVRFEKDNIFINGKYLKDYIIDVVNNM